MYYCLTTSALLSCVSLFPHHLVSTYLHIQSSAQSSAQSSDILDCLFMNIIEVVLNVVLWFVDGSTCPPVRGSDLLYVWS